MEETQNQSQENQEQQVETPTTAPAESVTFSPLPQKSSGSKLPKIIIIIVILVILGVGAYLILKRGSQSSEEIFPTSEPTSEEVTTPIPTSTPAPVDKTKIKIEIQNGTSISGEAAYLRDLLKNLGYSDIQIGNAEDQNETVATVTFAKTTASQIQDEITAKLKTVYTEVDVKTSSTLKTSVLVVTGLRKGQTPKPSATPTASPSTSPTPTAL
jgi:hypothetical protein